MLTEISLKDSKLYWLEYGFEWTQVTQICFVCFLFDKIFEQWIQILIMKNTFYSFKFAVRSLVRLHLSKPSTPHPKV